MALLHALPIAVLMVVGLASVKHTAAVPLPGWKMGVAAAAAATAAAAAALWLGEAALNARWGGQMSLLSYLGLALRLRGSKKLPYEWQVRAARVCVYVQYVWKRMPESHKAHQWGRG